jgi:hypothetical protein
MMWRSWPTQYYTFGAVHGANDGTIFFGGDFSTGYRTLRATDRCSLHDLHLKLGAGIGRCGDITLAVPMHTSTA